MLCCILWLRLMILMHKMNLRAVSSCRRSKNHTLGDNHVLLVKIEGAGLVYHLSSFSCCERGKHDIIMTSMVGECDMCDAVMHHSIVGWTWTCGHCTPARVSSLPSTWWPRDGDETLRILYLSELENGPVEIVDLPIDSMVDLSIVFGRFTISGWFFSCDLCAHIPGFFTVSTIGIKGIFQDLSPNHRLFTSIRSTSQWEGLSHILWKIKFMFETTNQLFT